MYIFLLVLKISVLTPNLYDYSRLSACAIWPLALRTHPCQDKLSSCPSFNNHFKWFSCEEQFLGLILSTEQMHLWIQGNSITSVFIGAGLSGSCLTKHAEKVNRISECCSRSGCAGRWTLRPRLSNHPRKALRALCPPGALHPQTCFYGKCLTQDKGWCTVTSHPDGSWECASAHPTSFPVATQIPGCWSNHLNLQSPRLNRSATAGSLPSTS